jgi:hypothetical protein
MNVGYKNTKYDYVSVHDYDDQSVPNRFKMLFDNIGDLKAISSSMLVNYEEENRKQVKIFREAVVNGHGIRAPAHHCCTILHKEMYDFLGEYNKKRYLCTDSERMIKLGIFLLLSKQPPIKMIQEPLYIWNRNSGCYSISYEAESRRQCKSRNVIVEQWEQIKKMNVKEFIKWWDEHFEK